jgi:acyl carrier protein
MTTQDVLSWIAEVFEAPVDKIHANTPRLEIPGWDSLGMLSLMAGLDERFHIQLTDQDIGKLRSVSDILDILRLNAVLSGE